MQHLRCSEEVQTALREQTPVVALETSILSHGMPYPKNLATARAVEACVRANGAVPAAIAVIDGVVRVGLSERDLELLATQRDVLKLSSADLAYAVARGRTGATTVAATMRCAHHAGINVFATGGIGGVHRGGEASMDISADLYELARTPVAVVCAGAKALLDLPRTLEVLETLGVPVVACGTDVFPAFWSRDSGLRAPMRLDTAQEIAAFIAVHRELRSSGGILVANPVPHEAEIPYAHMTGIIAGAVDDAARAGVRGKAVTPWLLDRILTLTGGRSLETNAALVQNNAALAASIARAYCGSGASP